MSFNYTLKTHQDIGYSNFFNTFREEYDELFHNKLRYNNDVLIDLINSKLSKYHAKLISPVNGILVFESEAHYHWFILRWQN